ncbi:Gfo/Idh/MocA family oxidoreductase [Coraliomargarita akajimensis]|uniref:Oxidoreductase domain protein n=1 Tax=Coraliomargarita akajimensis (strain DSM 45221 / IAM 15411 / JCM 23193 / KCTC 12865 / 04OKA010-24) TaxID=583355 RepID=D5EIQ5_CORAD|nr:Gfo/Idh/MocA family oxidoreductase [Coraliomargarita akajimensis]ADE54304.1 oxidoreductase domain protein [Coraliomargarita akajimensis DSM 45221]
MKHKDSRRQFLKTAAGATALIGFPTIIPSSVLGSNGNVAPSNRVNVGLIGCGRRSGVGNEYNMVKQSQLVAVCDPVKWRREAKAAEWNVPDSYNDFRDLLARDDIDAVHVVTPDHWHVPISLAAARAGKDIYCEKPLGISIEQDLAARQIVEKYDRVFQYGTQQRSMQHLRMGIELVLNGHIGEVKEVYVWAPQGANGGKPGPELPVPEGFDYDLWLGPAPMAPFCEDRCSPHGPPKGSYFVYDYTIGMLGGWGSHPMDQFQWWADAEALGIPDEYKASGVVASGGLYDTVYHWDLEASYKQGLKLHFLDNTTARKQGRVPLAEAEMKRLDKFKNCTVFIGDSGWVAISREGLVTSTPELRRMAKNPGERRLVESQWHPINFIDSVRKREQPVSTLDSAVRSDIICHLTDISIRTGERLGWDHRQDTLIGSQTAASMMTRPMRAPWSLDA